MRLVLLCAILIHLLLTVSALNLESLRYCCGLGTNFARTSSNCENFQTPIPGVEKENEESCLHSVQVCCRKQTKESECSEGIEDAKNGDQCGTANELKKDCCEACQFGIQAAKAQQGCDDTFGLGTAFVSCCNDATYSSSSTSEKITTEQSQTSEVLKSTAATKSQYSPLPPLENVCDIGDVCAQICIPTADSYKCDCNKGFSLMADGISCKPDKRTNSRNKGDRCSMPNPCDHICTDTGVAIKCSCREGFELANDKRTCKDIDECATGVHECDPNDECINEEGSYFCDDPNFQPETDLNGEELDNSKCPQGFKFNFEKLVCDDINECEFDIICPRPKTCINTIGSFRCEGEDRPQCPPGFEYRASTESCTDIDECLMENDCNKESQICFNTHGNYTCLEVSTKTCPAGFKKNPYTQNCDDINECEENEEMCGPNEDCVNERGFHRCVPKNKNAQVYPLKPPYEPTLPPKPTDFAKTSTTSTSTTTTTPKPQTTQRSCPNGYRSLPQKGGCVDIDECQEDPQACDSTQECYNAPGSFLCRCKIGFTKDHQTGACMDINECQVGSHDCTEAQRCDNTVGSYMCNRITGCGTGYTLNYANGLCEDDDECALGTHSCNDYGPNFKCRNTLGSYRCDPVRFPRIFPKPQPTQVPVSSQTPQIITVTRGAAQPTQVIPSQVPPRVIPTSNLPPRIVPTPNVPPRISQSSNYPTFFTPQVIQRGQTQIVPTQTYPIISGTLKKCLPGYIMNEQGACEDINECQSNPCLKGQKCLNFNGRYQCLSALQCKIGYELDDSGETCVDVNECTRGTHKCKDTQICKNGQGFYTCECPPGHHINPITQACEDIDECKYYKACSGNAECINTVGSYKCRCKEGFRERGNMCEDIDECRETSRLCEHSCVNIWGSYRCACKPGFTLNFDNRTCTDIDECDKFRDNRLCIGNCENIPGSYRCRCPKGYRLGSDGRTCLDIDECQQNICPRHDDVCLNTRGGHKCYTITCPPNYFRDPQHKGRCKRPLTLCDPRDVKCILMPEQYTYHYITLVSKLPISSDNVQFFQINGPKWAIARAEFSMKVVNVIAGYGVERVTERFFKMVKPGHNTMQLYLVKSIEGPQEIELKVEMHLFQGNVMTANVVSHIFIVVSEYQF